MPRSARDKLKLAALSLLAVLLVRSAVSLSVIGAGFHALSDDDFSRVVIAQSFAWRPRWDPSGTSWLPLPFWLYGTCMTLCGATLACARVLAFTLGLVGALGLWLAGRWLGLSRNAALLGTMLACAVPYAAWLGVATTPDYFTAVLVLLACCSLARRRPVIRICGAAALTAAVLSRYEAWPLALVWSLWVAAEAVRRRDWRSLALAAAVLVAPLGWMAHGVLYHGDALFFIKRVVNYRRALGVAGADAAARLLSTPQHLLRDAPELWAMTLVCSLGCWLAKVRPLRQRWCRPLLGMLSIVILLMIGDWRDGAATHHVGRTLLPVWLLFSLLLAKGIADYFKKSGSVMRVVGAVGVAATYALAWTIIRPAVMNLDQFCPRIEETNMGALASSRVPRGERLAIYTRDYGYFAVEAAFARPNDVVVLDTHDPRRPVAQDILRSKSSLARSLNGRGADWLVLPTSGEALLSPESQVRSRGSSLSLCQLR